MRSLRWIFALLAAAEPAAQPTAPQPANSVSGLSVQATPKGKPPRADVTLNMQASDDDLTQMVTIWPGAATTW